jgi:hypothetical protein
MRTGFRAFALVIGLATTVHAGWENNQCVKCHETEILPITLGHSFADWRASAHAHGGVGCEKCHGGDPRSTQAEKAHAGVRPSTDPQSLVHPTHLPETCGACHRAELDAFQGTVHARQLREKGSGATCFTCHGAMATSLPTPRELTARCAVCHDKPVEAHSALVVLAMAKARLYRARRAMDEAKTADPSWHAAALGRFHDLERDYHAIQVQWHVFGMKETLESSRDLIKLAEALTDEAEVKTRRARKK